MFTKSDFMKDLQISEEIPVYKKKIDDVKELCYHACPVSERIFHMQMKHYMEN